ncbi:MAG: manganese efflux pump MntP family protein [Burkholderiales bacterium]
MGFAEILVLAVGLSMDAAAAAAARGFALRRIRARHVFLVSIFFGGSQALMPWLGWMVGAGVGPLIRAWDHWLAFALLFFLGARMLRESYQLETRGAGETATTDFRLRTLLVLAIATSIDAFAAGIALPMMNAPLLLSVVTIGFVTAILSAIGLFAGHRFGAMLGSKLDLAGGVLLIGLGAKIFIEHEFLGGG